MHFIRAKQILSSAGGCGTNIYRGCQHGCIYCDSRSRCYHIDHPFEDIAVKQNAPELLEDALRRRRKPCMIGTGSMCDPYMPVEQDLQLTRRCLEIIEKYRFGATVLTKSDLVLRDLDILTRINAATKAVLQITLTTFDEALCRIVEPAVCTTRRRFEVMCAFQDAGVPVVVWLSPILPFINDSLENLEGILDYCIRAGVRGIIAFGFGLTLREGNREYFYAQLDRHFPGLRRRYEQTYGFSYSLPSPNENSLKRRFNELCSTHGILHTPRDVFNYLNLFENSSREHTVPEPVQGELF